MRRRWEARRSRYGEVTGLRQRNSLQRDGGRDLHLRRGLHFSSVCHDGLRGLPEHCGLGVPTKDDSSPTLPTELGTIAPAASGVMMPVFVVQEHSPVTEPSPTFKVLGALSASSCAQLRFCS